MTTYLQKIQESFDSIRSNDPGSVPSRKEVFREIIRRYSVESINKTTLAKQWQEFRERNHDIFKSRSHVPVPRRPIPTPCPQEVEKYLKFWHGDRMKHYQDQEACIGELFRSTCAEKRACPHDSLEMILTKTLMLNSFYSTKLNAPLHVAKHVEKIKDFYVRISHAESKPDYDLVDEIARGGDILIDNNQDYGKPRNCFSFATKYCHHHKPDAFRIYDSFVAIVLRYFQAHHTFYPEDFSGEKLKKSYHLFHRVWDAFKNHELYGISQFKNWELDKYLWLLGKEYFPRVKSSRRE